MIQETQLDLTPESDPFGFRAVESGTPAAGKLPGERPHEDETLYRLHRQERPAKYVDGDKCSAPMQAPPALLSLVEQVGLARPSSPDARSSAPAARQMSIRLERIAGRRRSACRGQLNALRVVMSR